MSLNPQKLLKQAKGVVLIVGGSARGSGTIYLGGIQRTMEQQQPHNVSGQPQQIHDMSQDGQVNGVINNAQNTTEASPKPTDTQAVGSVPQAPTQDAGEGAMQPEADGQQRVTQGDQHHPPLPSGHSEHLPKREPQEAVAPDQTAIQIENLQRQVVDLQKRLIDQERQSAKDASEHRIKLTEYIRKTQRLNQIIIKYGQSDEPADGDLESQARDIRSSIKNLVMLNLKGQKIVVDYNRAKQISEYDNPYYQRARELRQDPFTFYMGLRGRSAQIKRALLIERLFLILDAEIFRSKWFGLDDRSRWIMENGLREFENLILKNSDKEEIEEWRKRTVALARGQKIRPQGRAHEIARIMFDYLTCSELSGTHGNSDKAREKLFDGLKELCENALNLTLQFRATRTKYSFQALELNSTLDRYSTNEYEVMGMNGDLSQDPLNPKKTRVFCNLWGALVKTKEITATEEEKRVVIAPAHIYVYEDS